MKIFSMFLLLAVISGNTFAAMHKEVVEYKHGDTTLKGHVYWEDAYEGRRPGVLVFPEIWGVNDYVKLRAEMLAETGYVAFAADMYGDAKDTREIEKATAWHKGVTGDVELWRERAEVALKEFKSHEQLDRKKMAVLGFGFGGATALQLAATGVEIGGVISMHGSIPEISKKDISVMSTRILLLNGSSDKSVSSEALANLTQVMTDAAVDWEMNVYGGAKHSFSNPYADSYGIDNTEYNLEAEQRSWARILTFFEELFDQEY